ncbi:hypothetical protein SAMN05216276_1001399 [Streptosporangium subroseum]|uniref:Uncharacterized protein n=1 Tax=Streptosporangium subroseum TaxID=106412 RepID=A0A239AGV7_9ACTN|nr:hypothetical protein SAMN05216276_1001399 [Streptosporangium subroseum]
MDGRSLITIWLRSCATGPMYGQLLNSYSPHVTLAIGVADYLE